MKFTSASYRPISKSSSLLPIEAVGELRPCVSFHYDAEAYIANNSGGEGAMGMLDTSRKRTYSPKNKHIVVGDETGLQGRYNKYEVHDELRHFAVNTRTKLFDKDTLAALGDEKLGDGKSASS
ncbi:hypothetical protein N7488_011600 [Penicillium malachiteum]|nr:hypothetical protein N7488_011600 [Penicillium malachiteum]